MQPGSGQNVDVRHLIGPSSALRVAVPAGAGLRYLFSGRSFPPPCGEGSAGTVALPDANGDARLDAADCIHLLAYFFGGAAPPVRGTSCVHIEGRPTSCWR